MQGRSDAGAGPVTFLDRTYHEAVDLLTQLRDYLAVPQRELVSPRPVDSLNVALETTRLTAMLTSAVAWLLVRKAVGSGEMTPVEAAKPEHRLAGSVVALTEHPGVALPPRLDALHARCRALYARVARLDELVARSGA
jgi:regulator of CtrA degradation